MKVFALLPLLLSAVAAQAPAGGENYGIPIAPLPIPFDKCSIAASNDAEMRLTVVAWGYNNEFWVGKQEENWGPMGEWKSIGGFFTGGPTVIRNANNDIVIFGRRGDRKVWYKVFHADGAEEDWVVLDGKLMSGRVSAVVDPQGLIHIFARGKDSAIWQKRQYANGTEAVWGEWATLGGIVSSNPSVVLDAEGMLHLFARGVDGHLWRMGQKLQDDGSLNWTPWEKHADSVYLSSAATITTKLNAQNLVEVVVRGGDKAMWHTRQAVNDERGVVWTPFKSLGGIFSSAPSVQINTDQLLTVYGRGPEKGVWYKQQAHHPVDSPSDAWSMWVPLGGRFSASIDAIPDARGYVNLFGRGLDKAIWTRTQMFHNNTVGFFGPWKNLGGRFRSFPC